VLETHAGDARAAAGLLPAPTVASYTVVDSSEAILAVARLNLGDRATVVHAQSQKLPFADASFDRYLSNVGLCCTVNSESLTAKLTEARRVLAPGGAAAMSTRIEGGAGDTAFGLIQSCLAPFGRPAPADREGPLIGKDLAALKARVAAAGFRGRIVAWHTWAPLPVHDADAFVAFATAPLGTKKFLGGLATEDQARALASLRAAGAAALEAGAIQMPIAVVVAWCECEASRE
jgi:SAM-dependent methyltransferase